MNTGSWLSERLIQTFRVFDEKGTQLTELVLGMDVHAGDPKILRQVADIISEYEIKYIVTNFPPAKILFSTVQKVLETEYGITDVILDVPAQEQHSHDDEDEIKNEDDVV